MINRSTTFSSSLHYTAVSHAGPVTEHEHVEGQGQGGLCLRALHDHARAVRGLPEEVGEGDRLPPPPLCAPWLQTQHVALAAVVLTADVTFVQPQSLMLILHFSSAAAAKQHVFHNCVVDYAAILSLTFAASWVPIK